jgi:signal transduction histidine kinase
MTFRTWPVAAIAFGALLVLVAVAVLASARRAQEIYSRLDALNGRYHDVDYKLRRLRSDVNLSGIFVRDYLLDPVRERAPEYRRRIVEFRRANMQTFDELRTLAASNPDVGQRLAGLRAKLDDYWQTLDPLFDWTPAEKASQSAHFLRTEVLPRREAVLAIASEIEEINNATLAAQRTEVAAQQAQLRRDHYTLLWTTLLLGSIVALTAVYQLRRLEHRSDEQRRHAEEAETGMRRLSQQLVAAQEAERTSLSRELHDHVGQVLTALRMELGTIDRSAADPRIAGSVQEARQLVDSMVRTVRHLALGLRPSMLDDLGLQSALEWHASDFSRRYGLPVHLTITGDLDRLPEQHRTCTYRIVQEALTNCIRHAAASCVRVTVTGRAESLDVAVVDDGIGFRVDARKTGLGLRGIEERARELGGTIEIQSVPGAGTSLLVRLPSPEDLNQEVMLAHSAR